MGPGEPVARYVVEAAAGLGAVQHVPPDAEHGQNGEYGRDDPDRGADADRSGGLGYEFGAAGAADHHEAIIGNSSHGVD